MSEYFHETPDGRSLRRVSIESKSSKTIKTNDAASVAANGFSYSDWYDCEGFDKIAVTAEITGSLKLQVDVEFSHDKVARFGAAQAIGTSVYGAVGNEKPTLAKWFRVAVKNTDTALVGVVNAYSFLKI
jgi:hypothetical protein